MWVLREEAEAHATQEALVEVALIRQRQLKDVGGVESLRIVTVLLLKMVDQGVNLIDQSRPVRTPVAYRTWSGSRAFAALEWLAMFRQGEMFPITSHSWWNRRLSPCASA